MSSLANIFGGRSHSSRSHHHHQSSSHHPATVNVEDKNFTVLKSLSLISLNKSCFDCGQRGPTYVNMTIGSFVCTSCSGKLRGLNPPHRLKSITMATFTPQDVDFLKDRGNEFCRKVWLAKYPGILLKSWIGGVDCSVKSFSGNGWGGGGDGGHGMDILILRYEKKSWYVEASLSLLEETRKINEQEMNGNKKDKIEVKETPSNTVQHSSPINKSTSRPTKQHPPNSTISSIIPTNSLTNSSFTINNTSSKSISSISSPNKSFSPSSTFTTQSQLTTTPLNHSTTTKFPPPANFPTSTTTTLSHHTTTSLSSPSSNLPDSYKSPTFNTDFADFTNFTTPPSVFSPPSLSFYHHPSPHSSFHPLFPSSFHPSPLQNSFNDDMIDNMNQQQQLLIQQYYQNQQHLRQQQPINPPQQIQPPLQSISQQQQLELQLQHQQLQQLQHQQLQQLQHQQLQQQQLKNQNSQQQDKYSALQDLNKGFESLAIERGFSNTNPFFNNDSVPSTTQNPQQQIINLSPQQHLHLLQQQQQILQQQLLSKHHNTPQLQHQLQQQQQQNVQANQLSPQHFPQTHSQQGGFPNMYSEPHSIKTSQHSSQHLDQYTLQHSQPSHLNNSCNSHPNIPLNHHLISHNDTTPHDNTQLLQQFPSLPALSNPFTEMTTQQTSTNPFL